MQIAKWDQHQGREVAGTYRLVECVPDFWNTKHKPRSRLILGDATGTATCVVPVAAEVIERRALSAFVRVSGTVSTKVLSHATINVTDIAFVAQPNIKSWHLLPREWVAEEGLDAFDKLLGLLDRLQHEAMVAFVDQVFSDGAIAKHFLNISASRKHHHPTPGGLLNHSVECAEMVEEMGRRLLSPHERDLAVVGALLHDIGKIRTLCPARSGTGAIHGVCQSALNLEVLAPYMPDLQTAWSSGANALRAILAPARYSMQSGGWSPLLLTDVVRYIDRLSAGKDLRTRSFSDRPDWQCYMTTPQGQPLVRVLP